MTRAERECRKTTWRLLAVAAVLLAWAGAGCGDDNQGTGSPTPTPTATGTATPLSTSTSTPSATATASPVPTSTPTATRPDTPTATPTENPLRLPALHAEPDAAGRGRIVDGEGREVLLRGVNVNALVDYWKGTDLAVTFPFTEADADAMAAIGWDAVRLLLSWSRVEPAPGSYDDDYLGTARTAVRVLAARGIYSIIDLHQDAWGATLAAASDVQCPAGTQPALGWDGAPGWATLDGGAVRCATAGIRETSAAVLAAFQAFWDDAPGPGGVGIRTRYAHMLGHVAGFFAAEPGVAGYDLMNEPNAFTPAQQQALADLYVAGDRRDPRRGAGGGWIQPARSVRAVGAVVGSRSGRAARLRARSGRRLRAARLHGGIQRRADHRARLRGRAGRGAAARRRAGAVGRVGHRSAPGRESGGRLLRPPPGAAGPVRHRRHAVDLARVLRRSAQGRRLSRRPRPLSVGRVRGRLRHQHGPGNARDPRPIS